MLYKPSLYSQVSQECTHFVLVRVCSTCTIQHWIIVFQMQFIIEPMWTFIIIVQIEMIKDNNRKRSICYVKLTKQKLQECVGRSKYDILMSKSQANSDIWALSPSKKYQHKKSPLKHSTLNIKQRGCMVKKSQGEGMHQNHHKTFVLYLLKAFTCILYTYHGTYHLKIKFCIN